MAQDTGPAMGMSVGATALCAVTADRAITRRPVLTLYRDRPSRIGTPSENPDALSDLDEHGLVVTDFVDRVGEAEPVAAADGSTHRAEQLLADALHALAYTVTEGDPLPPAVAVTHPAHWSRRAVDALRTALGRVSEWSQQPVSLTSDVVAVLTALRANPGLPDQGVIAVCDFGGSGTSITLVDAARDYEPIGVTRRHTAFSGDVIDQALLDHVVADLSSNGSDDGPPTVGSLTRLRSQCRDAKERLSTETVAELAGFHGGAWLTRAELDEAIRQPLAGCLTVVENTLADNDIARDRLAAIVSAGGGANLPAVTTALAGHFGVPVITSPRPQLTAAIGAALGVAGTVTPAPKVAVPTAETPSDAPVPTPTPPSPPVETVQPLLATDEPAATAAAVEPSRPRPTPPRPRPSVEPEAAAGAGGISWYRRPVPVIIVAAVLALLMGTIAVFVLRRAADGGSESDIPGPVATTTVIAPRTELPPAPVPVLPPVLPNLEGPELPENPGVPGTPAVPPTPGLTEEPTSP
ncbi:Hsp70 family protein [Mycobacterium sp. M1]|uniref:Hsp70 family protein n=1 Tax=Mycolicibacter acidiphilus TaxID=2835306 RepID=A0ABS5RGY5_9MYCO|nr:Hsp70 family protein [Mycolicibacter acidiphilus]MBS9533565.1 Hsp70 family protein [Mycolicibacter acidiphilus]